MLLCDQISVRYVVIKHADVGEWNRSFLLRSLPIIIYWEQSDEALFSSLALILATARRFCIDLSNLFGTIYFKIHWKISQLSYFSLDVFVDCSFSSFYSLSDVAADFSRKSWTYNSCCSRTILLTSSLVTNALSWWKSDLGLQQLVDVDSLELLFSFYIENFRNILR